VGPGGGGVFGRRHVFFRSRFSGGEQRTWTASVKWTRRKKGFFFFSRGGGGGGGGGVWGGINRGGGGGGGM